MVKRDAFDCNESITLIPIISDVRFKVQPLDDTNNPPLF